VTPPRGSHTTKVETAATPVPRRSATRGAPPPPATPPRSPPQGRPF